MTDKEEDLQLVRRILEDNSQNACTRLVNKYRTPLFQFMLERIRIETETEDLLQETFAKMFNNLSSFNPRYAFSTWLYNIARHSCIDYLRKKGNSSNADLQFLNADMPHEYPPQEKAGTTEDDASGSDAPWMHPGEMMACLPERYRTVFSLRYIERLKYRQISERTGMPMGTIKTYLFRAKAFLNAEAQKAKKEDA